MYFRYFVIISPWKRTGPFICANLNPLFPGMLCAKFGWNWLSGSGEEDFLISSMYHRYFVIIFPWKRAGCWRKRTFNFLNVFLLFRNYLPLEKGSFLHLNKLESPSPKDALWHVLLKLAQWFWRRRWKSLQTDGQTDRQTDRRQSTGDQKSSLELSAQVS